MRRSAPILFDPAALPPVIDYQSLFDNLPSLSEGRPRLGRRPFSRHRLLAALIYKALRRLAGLSDLTFELRNNPSITQVLGFNPLHHPPSVERFSRFLHETHNQALQTIHHHLVHTLRTVGVLSGKSLAMDSCPIVVALKENNLKTSLANRFDKTRRPAGDPDARLGVRIHYPTPFKKEVRYFWGYRNHVLLDTETELPVWETTKPAQIAESYLAKTMLRDTQHTFGFKIASVSGDANYDTEKLLAYIIQTLHAQAIIPHNPRNEQPKGYHWERGHLVCEAGLPMYRKGKMRPQSGILYCQYTCPLQYDTTWRTQYIVCPVCHPKFFKGKGCNAMIRLEPSIREHMEYDTQTFKDLYKSRTSVERIFSRLLSIAMQHPTVRGYYANRNHATIAHIAVLLVALTAYKTQQSDKIRFVRSFIPNFLKES